VGGMQFRWMALRSSLPRLSRCLRPFSSLSHVDEMGRAAMVDVGRKEDQQRRSATATSRVWLGEAAFHALQENRIEKGDVLSVARVAGIQAAKQTSNIIPMCHPLLLSHVRVDLRLEENNHTVLVEAQVNCRGPTGVEMEAMTAAATASLTVYDMCKAVSKSIRITDLQLEHKSGGKSGTYRREGSTVPSAA